MSKRCLPKFCPYSASVFCFARSSALLPFPSVFQCSSWTRHTKRQHHVLQWQEQEKFPIGKLFHDFHAQLVFPFFQENCTAGVNLLPVFRDCHLKRECNLPDVTSLLLPGNPCSNVTNGLLLQYTCANGECVRAIKSIWKQTWEIGQATFGNVLHVPGLSAQREKKIKMSGEYIHTCLFLVPEITFGRISHTLFQAGVTQFRIRVVGVGWRQLGPHHCSTFKPLESTLDATTNLRVNPLMLLACSVNTIIHNSGFHLCALCCASRRVSCLDEASSYRI